MSSERMGGIDIEESNTLDVLGMRIQCDVRWNEHVFQVSKEAFKCLGFLKRYKNYFTPSPYYLYHLHPTENGIQLPRIERDLKVCFVASGPCSKEGVGAH